jgi:hypothetical protein
MIDIEKLEEGLLIEANDFDMGVRQLVNDISVQYRHLDREETCRLAGNVIGSLFARNLVKLVKTRYRMQEEDVYAPISSADLSEKELETFFNRPETWDEMGVFSKTEPVEVRITKKGRGHLSTL